MLDRHLKQFLIVADSRSFSKAARLAYISPNALIQQMNLLEDRVGAKLFRRTNQGVTLTEAGESFQRDAKKILRLMQEAKVRAQEIEKARFRTVRIATSLLRPSKSIVDLWSNISNEYPDIHLQIVPVDDVYSHWLRRLETLGTEIDVMAGIYPSTLWHRPCQALKLADVPLACAVPRGHSLASKAVLRLEDLYGQTLLVVERGDTSYIDRFRDDIEAYHPQIHIQDVPAYDAETFNLCERQHCPMLTIESWGELHPSLVTIPCDWSYTVPYGIVYSTAPSDAVVAFIRGMSRFALASHST